MIRYLCISVTLLDELFHGMGDDGKPEWPPSPMRLFQALLAGSRTGCRNGDWSEAKAEAFRWLERREPPVIVGPAASWVAEYRTSVPNNDMDVVAAFWAKGQEPPENRRPERLRAMKTFRPQRVVSRTADEEVRPTLHYLWAMPEDEWAEGCPQAQVLCCEARHLLALGWGIDQAVADGRILTEAEASELPGRCWRAWRTHRPSPCELRIPTNGSLEDLQAVHLSFVSRIEKKRFNPPRKFRRFGRVAYLSTTELPPRPYSAFELPEGVAFRQEEAAVVAAMLRSLACQNAKADSHEFPGGSEMYVAGHARRDPALRNGPTPPRFSYLPLPTIGHEHADGMIRRVIIAEPFGGDGSHGQWAQRRLRNQVLHDYDRHGRGVLLDPWRSTSLAMLGRYVGEGTNWNSVTPVILPGFDDARQVKAEGLLLKAMAQASIPIAALESFTLRKAPFWAGAAHPRHYFVPEYLRRFSRWHVALRFREPVPGPLAIGAGRHVGLGLFAVVNEAAQQ